MFIDESMLENLQQGGICFDLFHNNIPWISFKPLHAVQQNLALRISEFPEEEMVTQHPLNVCFFFPGFSVGWRWRNPSMSIL
jgi:hypothetical protein